jgi:type IV secretory pathway TrbL component
VVQMNTKITMAAVVASILMLAVLVAVPAMDNIVLAGKDKCEAGNSGNEWQGNGPHKCPPGLDKDNDDNDDNDD